MLLNYTEMWGAGKAQWVRHPSLDFGSGHE